MQGPPPPSFNSYSGVTPWFIPTRAAIIDSEGYLTNVNGTNLDWRFKGSAAMPSGPPTMSQYLSITQTTGVPTYAGANKGALAYDSVGLNMYVFNGTNWVLVAAGGGVPNLAAVLAVGNNTGANNIIIDNPQAVNYTGSLIIGAEGAGATAVASSIALGRLAAASGIWSVTIGDGASSNGQQSVSIGRNAISSDLFNTCVGGNAAAGVGSQANVTVGSFARAGDATTNAVVIGHTSFSGNSIDQTVVIGAGASNQATGGILIGAAATLQTGLNTVVIGRSAFGGTGAANIVIGHAASATGLCTNAVIIGPSAVGDAASSRAVVVGVGAGVTGSACIAIGDTARAIANSTTAVGALTTASAVGATAVGANTVATATQATALGFSSQATFESGVAVGYASAATEVRAIGMGAGAVASGVNAIAIGASSVIDGTNCIGIGQRFSVATGSTDCIVIGSDMNCPLNTVRATLIGETTFTGSVNNCTLIGRDNINTSSIDTTIVGNNIQINSGGNKTTAIGRSHLIGTNNYESTVAGTFLYTGVDSYGSVMMGSNSRLSNNCYESIAIGASNYGDTNSHQSIMIGVANNLNTPGVYTTKVVGFQNNLTNVGFSGVFGNNNDLNGCTNVYVLGNNVTSTASDVVYFSPNMPLRATGSELHYYDATGAVVRTASTRKIKERIVDLPYSDRLLDIKLYEYSMKPGHCNCEPQCKSNCPFRFTGAIAEEVAEIEPNLTEYRLNKETMQEEPISVQYSRIGLHLIPVVRQLRDRVAELEAKFLNQ